MMGQPLVQTALGGAIYAHGASGATVGWRPGMAGLAVASQTFDALPGVTPGAGWVVAGGAVLVALGVALCVALVRGRAGRRRAIAANARIVAAACAIGVVAYGAIGLVTRSVHVDPGAPVRLGLWRGVWLVTLCLRLPQALLAGMLLAGAYGVITSRRWRLGDALRRATSRYWDLLGLTAIVTAVVWVPYLAPWSLSLSRPSGSDHLVYHLAILSMVVGDLVAAVLCFVPWSLMARGPGLGRALGENWRLIRDNRGSLAWFVLRYTALMLLVTVGLTAALQGGDAPMVLSIALIPLRLLPRYLKFIGYLAVGLLYLRLAEDERARGAAAQEAAEPNEQPDAPQPEGA
jgi:hypothetical protein